MEPSAVKTKIEKEIGKSALKRIDDEVSAQVKKLSQPQQTIHDAWIDYYMLFGNGTGTFFVPQGVQFYSYSAGFLCSKPTDNASLTCLVPILNCKAVRVFWDAATQQVLYLYGYQTKP